MNELRTTLDTGKETYTALKCKQNDDRTLILTLLSNGVVWIPEAGSILELRGKRSDSTVTIQTTTGITITNNVVTIELSKEFTKIQGTVELELNIRKLTEITTFTFILVIEPSVIQDGAIVSKNTSNLLDELNNVLDWGSMHLVKAVNGIVSLTKKHGQYSVGLTSGTRVVLPTVEQGEYVNIDYMFYADSDLGLVFDDNIKWSNRPIIQAGRSYRFSFRYVNGVWYGEWVKLERYIKDYIYKTGDTCDVLTGGYDLERIVNSGSITADFNRDHIGLWVTKDAQINLATISSIDLTNYTKLYLNLYYKAVSDYIGSSKRLSVTIGSTVILPPRPTVIGGGGKTIAVLDVSSITGSHQISFNTPGTTGSIGVDIYEAWLEKDEFVDTTQEIFTKSEKNKLASISAGANKVSDSTTNGNILIDNVETKVYTHPIGTNPHGTTKSDVGLGNVDNTSDLNKPISTATQTALDWINNNTPNTNNGGLSKTSIVFPPANGVGVNFYNSQSYSIYMSRADDSIFGGRLGETASDYNMYFAMNGDTRGFVFKRGQLSLAAIDASGNIRPRNNVVLENNLGIYGKRVDGTSDNLIKRTVSDTVQIGSVNHSTFIHSYSTPTITLPSGSYRMYHEGNKPLLSDLGTTIEYAKELSTVSTSTSVPPRTKKWTRLATLRLTMQYQETNIQFNIMNNDASADIITAIVSARVKQQTAMGTNPYTGVVVNGVGFNANNFKAIITTSAAASTLDLYVAMDEDWRTFSMSKTLSANDLSALTPLQPFIDLPADAKFVPVIFK